VSFPPFLEVKICFAPAHGDMRTGRNLTGTFHGMVSISHSPSDKNDNPQNKGKSGHDDNRGPENEVNVLRG